MSPSSKPKGSGIRNWLIIRADYLTTREAAYLIKEVRRALEEALGQPLPGEVTRAE